MRDLTKHSHSFTLYLSIRLSVSVHDKQVLWFPSFFLNNFFTIYFDFNSKVSWQLTVYISKFDLKFLHIHSHSLVHIYINNIENSLTWLRNCPMTSTIFMKKIFFIFYLFYRIYFYWCCDCKTDSKLIVSLW